MPSICVEGFDRTHHIAFRKGRSFSTESAKSGTLNGGRE
jgi:hypothetical protein